MKKGIQISIVLMFVFGTFGIILPLYFLNIILFPTNILDIIIWIGFIIMWIVMVNEGIFWIKNRKRSEWSDLVVILFLFITVFLLTHDLFDSFIGAFSIYLLFGISEMKEYEVLNKILLITVITYNIIFFSGLIDQFLFNNGVIESENIVRDTVFSLSFWLMLFLGFAFFGRKYIVVFRFMSPTYLTLALYLIAWAAVTTVRKFQLIEILMELNLPSFLGFIVDKILNPIFTDIYIALILSNVVIYVFSGPLLDLMMGYKKTDNPEIMEIVNEVAQKMGYNPKSIKVRFAKYPILNAMAYGAFFNKHMAIISPEIDYIPKDELKGIVAHEMAHLKGLHTFWLTLISSLQILAFKFLDWPVTMYDYTFDPDQPYPMWVFLVLNVVISVFIYIIVRDFEAHADKGARKAGYSYELAKGLFHLESFYSTSHEIGLDATLLSNEKESENNKMLNYFSTANYLNKNIISPSRGSLLSNLINSHPPSYHRIIATLNEEEISCSREAMMPFTFMKKENARKFLNETQLARAKYLEMATIKIKERFYIEDLRDTLKTLKKIDEINYRVGKTYAFLNFATYERLLGVIEDIFYEDDVAEPIRYKISITETDGTKKSIILNPFLYKEVRIGVNEQYLYKNEGILKLKEVHLDEIYEKPNKKPNKKSKLNDPTYLSKNTGVLVFTDLKNPEIEIKKPIFNKNLPPSIEYIKSFIGKSVFLKMKGTYIRYIVKEISDNFEKSDVVIQILNTITNELESYNRNEMVFKFQILYFPIHNDQTSWEMERKFLEYINEEKIRAYFILKKAVNSELDGFLSDFTINLDEKSGTEKVDRLAVKTIFGEDFDLEMKKIDNIALNQPHIILQKSQDVSGASKLINKFIQSRRPDQILM